MFNILFMTIGGSTQGIAMEYMLQTKQNTSRWMRLFYWIGFTFILSSMNVLMGSDKSTFALRNVLNVSFILIALVLFYSEPFWKRIVAALVVTFGVMTAELCLAYGLQSGLLAKETVIEIANNKNTPISVLIVGVGAGMSIITVSIVVAIWRKISHKGSETKYYFFFLIYLINHLISVYFMELVVWGERSTMNAFWSVMTSLVCQIILLFIVFEQAEKEALEKEMIYEQHKMKLEQIHNMTVAKRRAELLDIIEENKNMVETVFELLESDEISCAENYLLDWSERIAMTKEYPYCGIPILNVILSEKKRECDLLGVDINVDLKLPEEIAVEQMDLCSIMGNLLDNAIRAGKQIAEDKASNLNAEIEITAGCAGEYLIVKCKNTTEKAPGVKPEGTGLGLKILQDIAQRYQGDFYTKYEEHTFLAQLSLKYT